VRVRSADGTEIAVDRTGAGPPVVIVDGTFGSRAFPSGVADLLARSFTVLRHDRRGRHESGDTPPYAVEREIEDLAAVLAAAGGSAAVFGMSAGGVLALDAAAAGLPITRLAVYEPPLAQPFPADYLATLRGLTAEAAVDHCMVEAVGLAPEHLPALRADPNWPTLVALAPTLVYDATLIAGVATGPARWASITQPVLGIAGGASPEWAGRGMRELAELLPAGHWTSLPDQTHAVAAEALAPVLANFFTR
jgi:hypothetical protein